MASCFKILGYRNWYKELKTRRTPQQTRGHLVNATLDTPLDFVYTIDSSSEEKILDSSSHDVDLSSLIQQEIAKYMKDKGHVTQAHFSQTSFIGNLSTANCNHSLQMNSSLEQNFWIIDTGASNHMCHDLSLMTDVKVIQPPLPVFLPDGSTHYVEKVGQVILHGVLSLTDVCIFPPFPSNSIHTLSPFKLIHVDL